MMCHSDQCKKRPSVRKLAFLLLTSVMVFVALSPGPVGVAAQEPDLRLLVDGKEGAEVETYFEVSGVEPGDWGWRSIKLKNIGTDEGALLFRITDLIDDDNGITEPEDVVDGVRDDSDGTPDGDLGDNLYIALITDGSIVAAGYASELDGWQFICPLPSGSEITIGITWSVDWNAGNIIQTDICTFNMDFLLEHLELSNLLVPEQGYYCEQIPISVDVHYAGLLPLTFDLMMVITDEEGAVVYTQTKTVTLDADETETVHFTWHPIEGGSTYTVTINGLSYAIDVRSPPTPTPTPPPGGGGGGGGGGAPPRLTLDVDMWGKVTSGDRTAFGILIDTIEAVSDDGVVTLLIRDGTEVVDPEGNAIDLITVEPVEEPPPLPPGSYAIDAYDFTPPCTFEPAVELVMVYDEEALPEGFDEVYLVIQYYREDEGGWRELPTVVNTDINTVNSLIGHLTVFAIVARVPELIITGLLVSPIKVDPEEEVTITVGVENTGATPGSQAIELWIEGEFEDSQPVTLNPGAVESVTFTVSREESGTYRVAVDGFRGEFEVVGVPGFCYWCLIVGLLGGLLLAGALAYLLLRWRAAERKRHEEVTGGQL